MRSYKLCLMFLILTLTLSCACPKYARKNLVAPTVINAPVDAVWRATLATLYKEDGVKLKEVKHEEYFICAERGSLFRKERIEIRLEPFSERQTTMYFRIGKNRGDFKDTAYLFDKIKAVCEGRPLQSVLAERRGKLAKNMPYLTPEANGFSATYDCGYDTAFKCAITALENLGYMVSQVNDRVGLIQASKTSDEIVWNLAYGVAENVFETANVRIDSLGPQKTKVKLILFAECHYQHGFGRNRIETEIMKGAGFYRPFFFELGYLISLAEHQD